MDHNLRAGRVTSSNAWRLMGTPARRKTYVTELIQAYKLGDTLDRGADSQDIRWGNFFEPIVFHRKLGVQYEYTSKLTVLHPDKELGQYWAGTPDGIVKDKRVVELKCYQPKNATLFKDALRLKDKKALKASHPKEFWQGVSNAILLGLKQVELICYMPYADEFEDTVEEKSGEVIEAGFRSIAENYDGPKPWQFRFIYEDDIEELGALKRGGYYKDVTSFTFDVTATDRAELTKAVRDFKTERDKVQL